MSKHYYEVTGALKKTLLEIQDKRQLAHDKMHAFSKKHGGHSIAVNESLHVSFWIAADENPDMSVWKAYKHDKTLFSPRLGCKAGKLLDAEMTAICRECPSGGNIAEVIGMKVFGAGEGGLVWQTPGMVISGKRVIVVVPDRYTPPKKLASSMKRISDLVFEKLHKRAEKDAA